MVKTVCKSKIIDEIVESMIQFCDENLIQNEDHPELGCSNTEYNDMVKTTIKMVLPKWKRHLICRDIKWHLWHEKRLATPSAANIIWSAIVKQPNYVDYFSPDTPRVIESMGSMDGGFIEASRKQLAHIMNTSPLD